jgi:NADPH2:quinone reductase
MRAVRCHRFAAIDAGRGGGGSGRTLQPPPPASLPIRDVLRLERVPAPVIRRDSAVDANKVLIRTRYAGIQYPDYLQAMGLYQIKPELPYTPGMDVAGIVIDKGCDVPDDCVANLGRNYCAAYHSLKVIGNVGLNDLVLVTGSSGGVGMATIELARAMGCRVIAGVSDLSRKGALPSSAGADVVLEYGHDKSSHASFKSEFRTSAAKLGHPHGASLIVDVVHGDLFENALLSCIRPLGKICLVGFAGGQRPIRPGLVLIKEAMIVGSLWGRWARENPNDFRRNMSEIMNYMVEGRISARADNVFPLEDYAMAFELFEKNSGRGNTVISMMEDDSLHRSRL